jgi:hypothetical protein
VAIVALSLRAETRIVDKSLVTLRPAKRFAPPIWPADPLARQPVPTERAKLPLIVLAFSYAKRPA